MRNSKILSSDQIRQMFRVGPVAVHSEAEKESDLILAGELITPKNLRFLRTVGGGLISAVVSADVGRFLGLPYEVELCQNSRYPTLRALSRRPERANDEAIPRFSISVDEVQTVTGISDEDRTKTVRSLTRLVVRLADPDRAAKNRVKQDFISSFVSPGHVRLLIASEGQLNSRNGHSEAAITLCQLSDLAPIAITCELINGASNRSCSAKEVKEIARTHSIPFLSVAQIKKAAEEGTSK